MQQHDWQRMDVDDLGRARELWTPLAEAACETLLGEVIPAWVRACARDLAQLQRDLRAGGDHHRVATLLRNVPLRMPDGVLFARVEESVRQILAAALGEAVQAGAADGTAYYTADGWLVCLVRLPFTQTQPNNTITLFCCTRFEIIILL